jgi:hypothetical protein
MIFLLKFKPKKIIEPNVNTAKKIAGSWHQNKKGHLRKKRMLKYDGLIGALINGHVHV